MSKMSNLNYNIDWSLYKIGFMIIIENKAMIEED